MIKMFKKLLKNRKKNKMRLLMTQWEQDVKGAKIQDLIVRYK